jgi:hypothetical protein
MPPNALSCSLPFLNMTSFLPIFLYWLLDP